MQSENADTRRTGLPPQPYNGPVFFGTGRYTTGFYADFMVQLGILTCPECENPWHDQDTTPLQDECGHLKCRRCYNDGTYTSNPCNQCLCVAKEEHTRHQSSPVEEEEEFKLDTTYLSTDSSQAEDVKEEDSDPERRSFYDSQGDDSSDTIFKMNPEVIIKVEEEKQEIVTPVKPARASASPAKLRDVPKRNAKKKLADEFVEDIRKRRNAPRKRNLEKEKADGIELGLLLKSNLVHTDELIPNIFTRSHNNNNKTVPDLENATTSILREKLTDQKRPNPQSASRNSADLARAKISSNCPVENQISADQVLLSKFNGNKTLNIDKTPPRTRNQTANDQSGNDRKTGTHHQVGADQSPPNGLKSLKTASYRPILPRNKPADQEVTNNILAQNSTDTGSQNGFQKAFPATGKNFVPHNLSSKLNSVQSATTLNMHSTKTPNLTKQWENVEKNSVSTSTNNQNLAKRRMSVSPAAESVAGNDVQNKKMTFEGSIITENNSQPPEKPVGVHSTAAGNMSYYFSAVERKKFGDKSSAPPPRYTRDTTIKRFSCHLCTYSFESAEDLERHNTIHLLNKDFFFTCDICKAGFWQRRDITRHVRDAHNIVNYEARQNTLDMSDYGEQLKKKGISSGMLLEQDDNISRGSKEDSTPTEETNSTGDLTYYCEAVFTDADEEETTIMDSSINVVEKSDQKPSVSPPIIDLVDDDEDEICVLQAKYLISNQTEQKQGVEDGNSSRPQSVIVSYAGDGTASVFFSSGQQQD